MSDIDNEGPIRAKLIADMQAHGTLLPRLTAGQQTLLARQITIMNFEPRRNAAGQPSRVKCGTGRPR